MKQRVRPLLLFKKQRGVMQRVTSGVWAQGNRLLGMGFIPIGISGDAFGSTITVCFNEPPTGDLEAGVTLNVNGSPATINASAVDGSCIDYTIAGTLDWSDTLQFVYDADAVGSNLSGQFTGKEMEDGKQVTGSVAAQPSFIVDFTTGSATPSSEAGDGTPNLGSPDYTYSRSGTTETIAEGVGNNLIKLTKEDEIGFDGQRRVENKINDPNPANWSTQSANTTITTGIADPDGGNNAYRLTCNATSLETLSDLLAVDNSAHQNFSVYLKLVSSSGSPLIELINGLQVLGESVDITSKLTSDWQRFSLETDGYILGASATYGFYVRKTFVLDVYAVQIESVKGQTITAPSEFVSVGVGVGAEIMTDPDLITSDDLSSIGAQWSHSAGKMSANVTTVGAKQYFAIDTGTFNKLNGYQVEIEVVIENLVITGSPTVASLLIDNYNETSTGTVNLLVDGEGTYSKIVNVDSPSEAFEDLWISILQVGGGAVSVQLDVTSISIKALDHGANVDGVKYFNTENGNTVSSNVVTEATGAAIAAATNLGVNAWEQRTNQIESYKDFQSSTAFWAHTGPPTLNSSNNVAPDGAADAQNWDDTDSGAWQYIRGAAMSIAVTDVMTASIFLKKTSDSRTNSFGMYLTNTAESAGAGILVNSDTGAHGTETFGGGVVVDSGVEDFNDDWWRVWIVCSGTTISTAPRVSLYPAAGLTSNLNVSTITATGDHTIWGCQAEVGSFISPVIPNETDSAAATRNADDLQYDAANYSGEMTVLIEWEQPHDALGAGNSFLTFFYDSGSIAQDRLRTLDADGKLELQLNSLGGGPIYKSGAALTGGTRYKAAYSSKRLPFPTTSAENYASLNGSAMVLDSGSQNAVASYTPTEFFVGRNLAGGAQLNGNIKQLQVIHSVWTQAQLDAWTA